MQYLDICVATYQVAFQFHVLQAPTDRKQALIIKYSLDYNFLHRSNCIKKISTSLGNWDQKP